MLNARVDAQFCEKRAAELRELLCSAEKQECISLMREIHKLEVQRQKILHAWERNILCSHVRKLIGNENICRIVNDPNGWYYCLVWGTLQVSLNRLASNGFATFYFYEERDDPNCGTFSRNSTHIAFKFPVAPKLEEQLLEHLGEMQHLVFGLNADTRTWIAALLSF